MKKLFAILFIFIVIFSGCSKTKSQASNITFSVFDLDNNKVTQDILSEKKLTMVNIWATFCGPCINEMGELGELNGELKNSDVQIIGLVADVIDENGTIISSQVDLARQIVKETGADYLHLLPTDKAVRALLNDVTAVPTTCFFDSKGNLIGDAVIGAKDKASWKAEIDARLELLKND